MSAATGSQSFGEPVPVHYVYLFGSIEFYLFSNMLMHLLAVTEMITPHNA